MKSWVFAVVLMGYGSAASALPPPVQIAFSAGRVSVAVADAPVADVLAAWARIGNCELTGAEYLGTRRMSLHLTNVAEADALRAIVGAPSWYSTVVRDTPEALQSTFQRIAILPAAATAAAGSNAPAPETRYSYYSDPDADAAAMAQLAQLAAPQPAQPPQPKRPADVEPEAFYRYTEPQAPEDVITVAAVNRQPLHLTIGVDPEVLYTYAPTPEPTEPVVTSLLKPEPQALEPEQRFTYAETPEVPPPVAAPLPADGEAVPDLPVMLGFAGLERLPGRVIRYVVER